LWSGNFEKPNNLKYLTALNKKLRYNAKIVGENRKKQGQESPVIVIHPLQSGSLMHMHEYRGTLPPEELTSSSN